MEIIHMMNLEHMDSLIIQLERKDGTYDVYVKSDSERGHSHDHTDEELSKVNYLSNSQCIMEVEKDLKVKTKVKRLKL